MDDLIRKSDALETYADLYDIFDDNKAIQEELHKVFDKINDIPAAEPRQGEWIFDDPLRADFECSECLERNDTCTDICPNCGAWMVDKPRTYEEGMADAWKIAQTVFDSTVTLHEAMDVVKCMEGADDE